MAECVDATQMKINRLIQVEDNYVGRHEDCMNVMILNPKYMFYMI